MHKNAEQLGVLAPLHLVATSDEHLAVPANPPVVADRLRARGAVTAWVRTLIRSNVASSVVLAAAFGLAVVPAALATRGARLASQAADRYLDEALVNDVTVHFCPPGADPEQFAGPDAPNPCTPPGASETVETAIRRTGLVDSPTLYRQLFLGVRDTRDGRWWAVGAYGTTTVHRTANLLRPIVVSGKLPAPSSTTDVTIDESLANAANLRVGDWMTVASWKRSEWPRVITSGQAPTTPARRLRVAAVTRGSNELLDDEGMVGRYLGDDLVTLGFGVQRRYLHELLSFWGETVSGKLTSRATPASVKTALKAQLNGWTLDAEANPPPIDSLRRVVHTERNGTLVVAGCAALAALVFIAFTTARQLQRELSPWPTMMQLGLARRDLVAVAVLRAVAFAAPAALLGALATMALGHVPPFGTARRTLFRPPSRFDTTVLVALAALIVLGAFAGAAIAGLRVMTSTTSAASPAQRRAIMPSGPVTAIAVRWASSRVRTLTPVAVGIAAFAVSGILAATAQGLERSPRRTGAWWDASAGEFFADPSSFAPAASKIRANPAVVDAAGTLDTTLRVGDVALDTFVYIVVKGSPRIPTLGGRAPRRSDEIALGARTLRRLRRRIGDTIEVTQTERPPEVTKAFRIVGTAHLVDPMFQVNTADALLTEGGFRRLGIPTDLGVGTMAMTLRDGMSIAEAGHRLGAPFAPTLHAPKPARGVRNVLRLHPLARVIAWLIGALTFVAFTHSVVTATARRRHERGVLGMLGMTVRQLRRSATLAWGAVGLAGAVVGVLLGVLLERPIERRIERTLGLEAATARPPGELLLLVAGALGVAAALGLLTSLRAPSADCSRLRAE